MIRIKNSRCGSPLEETLVDLHHLHLSTVSTDVASSTSNISHLVFSAAPLIFHLGSRLLCYGPALLL